MKHTYLYNQTEKETLCWVYLLELKNKSFSICYTRNLYRELQSLSKSIRLVFYRSFTNITDGIAYKLLLENLSPTSIYYVITAHNPLNEDLRKDFINESEGKQN
ncbi:hypothetical protein D0T50_04125 [Bacteroides sp. 214]|uniref:hypothetical protein n=1 Tax=Bacteroides sp. 214 TaxID=2302935 RepID=UPI0013D2C345|nr:hypothetical protein [Bacteroides sp. 214]NDW12075.1 hypothetical protein [Bacteroides sp. 214]